MIRREGEEIILAPVQESLGTLVRHAVREFSTDYMTARDQPPVVDQRKPL